MLSTPVTVMYSAGILPKADDTIATVIMLANMVTLKVEERVAQLAERRTSASTEIDVDAASEREEDDSSEAAGRKAGGKVMKHGSTHV